MASGRPWPGLKIFQRGKGAPFNSVLHFVSLIVYEYPVKKILLAITGASGALYAKQFLKFATNQDNLKLLVVASENAHAVFETELGTPLSEFWPNIHSPKDFNVPQVSGSAKLDAMVIMPCSMGTLARIAGGISNDAITRAADVFLKEQRQLILVPRETPLNLIQLRNMVTLTEAGATILPAMPSFYSGQKTLEEATLTVVARVLDQLKMDHDLVKRWKTQDWS